jgi:type 1 glutamine amidotransferase
MKTIAKILPVVAALMFITACTQTNNSPESTNTPELKVLVLTSYAKDHLKMIAAAMPMLHKMADENHFSIDITDDPYTINDANLAHYQVFVQLQEAPFDMSPEQQAALQRFIEQGHGWVGIHAAGLTGKEFLGPDSPYWQWFETFMGGVLYSPHPAYQKGTLIIEDHNHPATKNLPDKMVISDEWYEFNESPRLNPDIHVLARADESTYHQNKPMGDHPMIWVNTKFPHTIYIAIGHDASLCANPDFQTLILNSILWAGSKD